MANRKTTTADGLVQSGLLPHVKTKFGAYEFAKRHPECVYRDGRRLVFLLDRIEAELHGESSDSRASDRVSA